MRIIVGILIVVLLFAPPPALAGRTASKTGRC